MVEAPPRRARNSRRWYVHPPGPRQLPGRPAHPAPLDHPLCQRRTRGSRGRLDASGLEPQSNARRRIEARPMGLRPLRPRWGRHCAPSWFASSAMLHRVARRPIAPSCATNSSSPRPDAPASRTGNTGNGQWASETDSAMILSACIRTAKRATVARAARSKSWIARSYYREVGKENVAPDSN